MTHSQENHLLFRRFLLVTAFIALSGILIAQLIASTHRDANDFTVHKRAQQWEQVEPGACLDLECHVIDGKAAIA